MSIELYQRLTGSQKKIAVLLAMPGIADAEFEFEFEFPRSQELARPVDLA